MKTILSKLTVLLLLASLVLSCFVGCNDNSGNNGDGGNPAGPGEFIDYASEMKLDRNSGRATAEVTVKTFVDGDTTHFYSNISAATDGVVKVRYLGVNTPESTGQIEPWGKKASDYTKSKLSAATSIVLESNDDKWNPDSTGERYLFWVWYKTAEMEDYSCLNFELIQSGLGRSSKVSDTVYASECTAMLNQAVTHKLHVFSTEKDPEFYYGSAIPLTLKELKTNIETYKGKSVSFEAVVAKNYGNTAYVEEYDEDTGLYFGMQVYYGFSLDYYGTEILKVGNRIRVVGSVQYYEEGGTYQISDIYYDVMSPDNDKNIQLISSGHTGAYAEMTADTLLSGTKTFEVTVVGEDEEETIVSKTLDVGYLALHSTVSMKDLKIVELYTTQGGSSDGAISITCEDAEGNRIVVRTEVLKDSNNEVITESYFKIGSVISVKGIIDCFKGAYQVKVSNIKDITFATAE